MMENEHLKDLAKIMGVEEEMIPFLPKLPSRTNTMNPWVRQFPGIFRGLKLRRGMTVLDIPCGGGGVSVPLAKKYGVRVIGYDILPQFVQIANEFARRHGVEKLCRFRVDDVRQVVRRKDICELLLWVVAPHLWGKSRATIRALRNCAKDGGLIFIADAYSYPKARSKDYEDYETLDDTTKGYLSCGDRLLRVIDYGGKLWAEDFQRLNKSAHELLGKLDNSEDERIIRRFLRLMKIYEKKDPKHLGLAIWIIQVNKE